MNRERVMNGGSSSNHFDSDIREVASVICRDFRDRFKKDPSVRIEGFLETLEGWVGQFDNEASHSARTALIGELICAEMELLVESAQRIDLNQYEKRFPGYAEVIASAAKRIKRLGGKELFVTDLSGSQTADPVARGAHHSSDDVTTGMDDPGLELEFDIHLEQKTDDTVPQKFGHYQQIEPINSGGFGTVCRAVDSRDHRVVALKFPRRDKFQNRPGLKAFIEEANKSMVLVHPGIVRTLAIEAHDGYLAIVQQFIDGADLKSPIVQPRNQIEIVALIANVADALAYAHREGIYHRDIKPSNILIDREGRPHLADFGLALHECDQLSTPSQRCGTTYYMPPELVAGLTRRLDGRSDIWSLGVVFYELLTHRKPFDGVTERDIFDQIENKDPRPPRQIDAAIDREIQRICLKCLERHQRDRYPTADEMAEDLRHWLEFAQTNSHAAKPLATLNAMDSGSATSDRASDTSLPEARNSDLHNTALIRSVVPKGIRAYSTEDAEFFLQLLPGTRDRHGIPDSIRFWLSRICEPVKPGARVPMAVLFGPSGSGKTSFIKAGLLPLLPAGVATVYLEANQAKTEDQLLVELRGRWPAIPGDLTLSDLFRGLSQGKWLPSAVSKLLIVIDQFEQHLSLDRDFSGSQLVKALRHCDGRNLQCILLARDDFLTRLSRFLDALEVDFREGENAQAIDLFDRKHARRVLELLGRAYEQLPPEPEKLSDDQRLFLEKAVDQLLQTDHVICVHLTLFAEMFRHRPWTTAELDKVGGVAGTGEKFLDLTFGPGARDKRLYLQRKNVQALLECLLPNESSDIRGAVKSEQQLIRAAGLEPQPFADLVKALEGQLRLITRSDPEVVRAVLADKDQDSQATVYYQLTHDYLVPSVRAWLENSWESTRAGRAKTRLRNLARLVVPGHKPEKLPTSLEWLTWQFMLPQKSLSEIERAVMTAAGKRFVKQAVVLLVMIALIGLFTFQSRRNRHANDLISRLAQRDLSEVPGIVQELQSIGSTAAPMLKAGFEAAEANSREKTRLAMALLPHDLTYLPPLTEVLTAAESSPEQIQTIVNVIRQYQFEDRVELQSIYDNLSSDPDIRFRALVADIALKQGRGDWNRLDGLVLSGLQLQSLSSIDKWLEVLKPAGPQFVQKLKNTLSNETDANKACIFAKALHSFLTGQERDVFFATAIQAANAAQFSGLMRAIEEGGTAQRMVGVLTAALPETATDSSHANLCVALFHLGKESFLIEMYQGGIEDQRSLLAVFASKPDRIKTFRLISLYDRLGLSRFGDPGLRRSVLQALAHHSKGQSDEDLRDRLNSIARHHVENDPDACCFSTSELIMSRLGTGSPQELRELRRMKTPDGILGNILIDRVGNAFAIVETENAKLAISTTELTRRAVFAFCKDAGIDRKFKEIELPFEIEGPNDLKLILDYCNWLSKQNQFPDDQICYPLKISAVSNLSAKIGVSGYRLPAVEEYREFNSKNSPMLKLQMDAMPIVLDYAWGFENSGAEIKPVGTLLPNALGIFDSFGNVQELSQSQFSLDTEWHGIGQTVRSEVSGFSVHRADLQQLFGNTWTRVGFRIVRRL